MSAPRSTRRRRLAGLGIGAVVVAVLAAVALFDGPEGRDAADPGAAGQGAAGTDSRAGQASSSAPSASSSPSAVPTILGPKPPPVDDALLLGNPRARVIIVEFGDFQCPQCGRFAREIKPRLMRKYVETGVLRLAWRDFPTFGEQSVAAAIAGRAAARQGRFWQFHDALYARRLPPRSGRLTRALLRDVAREAGCDLDRFDADVKDERLRKVVDADFTFGQDLGVPGTPAFLINGAPFFGAQPLSAFERAIEEARADL